MLIELENAAVMDDAQLEIELKGLPWIRSKFDDAHWIPKILVPGDVKAALEKHEGRFYASEFIYYLSQQGNVSRYRYRTPDLPKPPDYGKTVIGIEPSKPLCPECGEPMDSQHRGQHNHT